MNPITKILMDQGESLLNDKGVDRKVCDKLAVDITWEIARMPSVVVAVTSDFYWGKGEDLEAAIAKCHEAGARGSQEAVVCIYTGPAEELAKITVDGGGGVHRSQLVTMHRVGKVKLPMKQGRSK